MSTEDSASPTVQMKIMPNGPLRVSGPVEIVDNEGKVVFEGENAVICRCGLSANKPLCDGTHRKEGWSEEA